MSSSGAARHLQLRAGHHPDALSHTTTYTFDAANRLIAMTDPLSHTDTYGLDAAGERTTVTDPLGHVTTYTFTTRGQVATVTTPGQSSGAGYVINYLKGSVTLMRFPAASYA